MQEGTYPGPLQRLGLRGPSARDDRVRGQQFPYGVQLGTSDVLGGEAEDADAPGAPVEHGPRLGQHRPGAVPVGEGERQEGQRPVLGDGSRETRLITEDH